MPAAEVDWGDRATVRAQVAQLGCLLRRMPPQLRDDAELVLLAARSCPAAAGWASPRLQRDRAFATKLLLQSGLCLPHTRFTDDKALVLVAVRRTARALQWASARLLDDAEVVCAALCGGDGSILAWASPRLRRDPAVACAAVDADALALEFVDDPPLRLALSARCLLRAADAFGARQGLRLAERVRDVDHLEALVAPELGAMARRFPCLADEAERVAARLFHPASPAVARAAAEVARAFGGGE
jgi:hypothetical protein